MTVKELIERLKELDGELQVYRNGYEGGYTPVDYISDPREFLLDVNTAWYYGEHEEVDNWYGDKEGKSVRLAVVVA